jgi:hypothetical protein
MTASRSLSLRDDTVSDSCEIHEPHGRSFGPEIAWLQAIPAEHHVTLHCLIDGVDGWVGSFDPLTAFERETLALVLAAAQDDGTGVRLQVFTGEGADRNTWLFTPADIQILRIEVRA